MPWNWQQPTWPDFAWNRQILVRAEAAFLLGGGIFRGAVAHLGPEDATGLTVEAMSTEAVTTSEIEGEILDRASVQSSIRQQLGLAADDRRIRPAERGIAEMMVDLHRGFAEPLSPTQLFAWHRMLTGDPRDLSDIGAYRTRPEPMQVVSGAMHAPKIHFEAPPSAAVPGEMQHFIDWFNRTGPGGGEILPALTRAGLAHLHFVSIHPFEDGNGRIARAIAEKALAQSLGRPSLLALASTILAKRRGYYDALEANNKDAEITPWLGWFAVTVLEAQQRMTARAEFLIDKTRLLDQLRGRLNARQEKALQRMLREGPEGFAGGLSAGKYVSITGTTAATATRDLSDMVTQGALVRTGDRRHTRYHLAIPLRPVGAIELDEAGG
jgi:Fic family protein